MKSIDEGKEITREIAEMLKQANTEQKILIKGILIGSNVQVGKGEKEDRKAG